MSDGLRDTHHKPCDEENSLARLFKPVQAVAGSLCGRESGIGMIISKSKEGRSDRCWQRSASGYNKKN